MNAPATYSTDKSQLPGQSQTTCLLGQGITCGLRVTLYDDSSIRIGAGAAILPNGTVLRVTAREFWNYRKQPQPKIAAYFGKTRVWELTTDEPGKADDIDSIVPQYRTDNQPGSVFLDDKIILIHVDEQADDPLTFVLVRQVDMVRMAGLEADVRRLTEPVRQGPKGGIFTTPRTALSFDADHIEAALFPYRQLPHITLPRFGYKTLARIDKNRKWDDDQPETPALLDNLRPPFEQIKHFADIFNEYKAILDEGFPDFRMTLRVLHTLFGPLLSDNPANPNPSTSKTARSKEASCTEPVQDAFAKYREVLCRKWQYFKEEGEHLYYIQYFYDWLANMLMAYNELRQALANFSAECHCDDAKPDSSLVHLLKLGPVAPDELNHKPLIFRDYFQEPFTFNHNEERLRELRCLHHRLMMMIWTFDLPALQLERKVLMKGGYIDGADEFNDSTNYWERLIARRDDKQKIAPDKSGKPVFDLNQLPVRITPGRALTKSLGYQAIPYYYPLDINSPYSVHRFWEFGATKTNRIDRHLSYNAYLGDDSYTEQPDILFPLAFDLPQPPFLRTEGFIGRQISRTNKVRKSDGTTVSVTSTVVDELNEIIQKYTLCLDVLLVDISILPGASSPLALLLAAQKLRGLEHQNGGYAGQTLVLFYTSAKEDIELNECRKDKTPEIPANTIVADFTIPYLFTLLPKPVL